MLPEMPPGSNLFVAAVRGSPDAIAIGCLPFPRAQVFPLFFFLLGGRPWPAFFVNKYIIIYCRTQSHMPRWMLPTAATNAEMFAQRHMPTLAVACHLLKPPQAVTGNERRVTRAF
jgi:hypothetical protein